MNTNQILNLAADAGKYYYLPQRFYHTLAHANTVANLVELINGSFDPALYIAAWFHDSVYVPGADEDSNELCSAALMKYESKKYDIDPDIIDEAYWLIARTSIKHHMVKSNYVYGYGKDAILLDADLSSLANDFDTFKANQDLIIQENLGNIKTDRPKCAKFLRDLAACRKFIYHTPYAQEHWEAKAQQNISDYCALVLT